LNLGVDTRQEPAACSNACASARGASAAFAVNEEGSIRACPTAIPRFAVDNVWPN